MTTIKFNPSSVMFDKTGYNEYIRRNAPKQLDKIIDELDDEDCIEGYTIGLSNSRPTYFDQLWLIDTPNGYIPVLIQNVNTSSYFAMWVSDIYCDEEEEDETEWSLDDVINFVGNGWGKGLKKIIEKEYINKKKEDSIDDIFSSL